MDYDMKGSNWKIWPNHNSFEFLKVYVTILLKNDDQKPKIILHDCENVTFYSLIEINLDLIIPQRGPHLLGTAFAWCVKNTMFNPWRCSSYTVDTVLLGV